jgi:hypothetical protein
MIIELVTFPTPAGMSRQAEYDGALHAAGEWIKNGELVAKHFMRGLQGGDNEGTSGAVYMWPSMEASKRGHDAKWLEGFRKRNGCDPTIQYFDLMLSADGVGKQIVEYEAMGEAAE